MKNQNKKEQIYNQNSIRNKNKMCLQLEWIYKIQAKMPSNVIRWEICKSRVFKKKEFRLNILIL